MPALITSPAAGLPPLPSVFSSASTRPTLRYQGAEALIYETHFPTHPLNRESTAANASFSTEAGLRSASQTTASPLPTCRAFLKHRPRKPYRHAILDAKLTRHRILSEARVLSKLRREGVSVPALYALDWEAGWMMGEWIDGSGTVRGVLEKALPGWVMAVEGGESEGQVASGLSEVVGRKLVDLMSKIGRGVGRMHEVGVVHGDLTTSNLLLRPREANHENEEVSETDQGDALDGEVVIIDFGLAAVSSQDEDRAVDLYVLERAFGSTHPRTEGLFGELLKAYGESYKGARVVVKKLEEVRMRGRKKIMIG